MFDRLRGHARSAAAAGRRSRFRLMVNHAAALLLLYCISLPVCSGLAVAALPHIDHAQSGRAVISRLAGLLFGVCMLLIEVSA